MKRTEQIPRRAPDYRRGQSLILMTLAVPLLFGVVALAVDLGFVYRSNLQLQASTQAAALAGGLEMGKPGATAASVTAAATAYSGTATNYNAYANLPNVTFMSGYPLIKCSSGVTSAFGVQCYGPGNSNALVVKQQVSAPLSFFRIFGFSSVNLKAVATVAMKGASVSPYNVAIVVDATGSMNTTDSDSNCALARIECALNGVQVLLNTLSPCLPSSSSCGTVTSGNVANSVDRVSLLTFPAVTTATAARDYDCTGTPTTAGYDTPFPSTSTYRIVDFSSDYRTSNYATSLSSSSNLVKAVKGTLGTPCLQATGGQGSYMAQAITQAQAQLVAERALFPAASNVLILLSDGDFGASSSHMSGASTTSGTYISTIKQCHQAVTAAQNAAAAGTLVYTVAYGAAASGCATDTSPTITPCQTMQQMASNAANFFSDYTATGGSSGCISASQPITGLNQIFKVIATTLGGSRLIQNTTP